MKRFRFSGNIQFVCFLLDLLMMAILSINLIWILFDWIYALELVKTTVSRYLPGIYHFYEPVHQKFFYYDLCFVSVYVTEILIRWTISIKRRTYHRWFFYPFIHWYDVLGSVPIGSLRFLRIIRIVSIIFRLQRLHMIDFTRTYIYQKFVKYLNILTEEISDKVILKILTGFQEELQQGNPLVTQINNNLLRPKKGTLVIWLSNRFQNAINTNYSKYKEEIRQYIRQRIKLAIEKNRELASIGAIPVLGKKVNQNIESLVADLVFNVLNDSMEDVATNRISQVIDEITEIILESILFDKEQTDLGHNLSDTLEEAIEIIKDHVRVQQWKLREEIRQEDIQDYGR